MLKLIVLLWLLDLCCGCSGGVHSATEEEGQDGKVGSGSGQEAGQSEDMETMQAAPTKNSHTYDKGTSGYSKDCNNTAPPSCTKDILVTVIARDAERYESLLANVFVQMTGPVKKNLTTKEDGTATLGKFDAESQIILEASLAGYHDVHIKDRVRKGSNHQVISIIMQKFSENDGYMAALSWSSEGPNDLDIHAMEFHRSTKRGTGCDIFWYKSKTHNKWDTKYACLRRNGTMTGQVNMPVDNRKGGNNGQETIKWKKREEYIYLIYVHDYTPQYAHFDADGTTHKPIEPPRLFGSGARVQLTEGKQEFDEMRSGREIEKLTFNLENATGFTSDSQIVIIGCIDGHKGPLQGFTRIMEGRSNYEYKQYGNGRLKGSDLQLCGLNGRTSDFSDPQF